MPIGTSGLFCRGGANGQVINIVGAIDLSSNLLMLSLSAFDGSGIATDFTAEWGDGVNWQAMVRIDTVALSGQVTSQFQLDNPITTYDRFRITSARAYSDGAPCSFYSWTNADLTLRFSDAQTSGLNGATLNSTVLNSANGDTVVVSGFSYTPVNVDINNQFQTVIDIENTVLCNNYFYGHASKDFAAGNIAEVVGDFPGMTVAVIRDAAGNITINDSDTLLLRATESDSITITGLVQIIDSDSLRLRIIESDAVGISGLVQVTDSDTLLLLLTEDPVTSVFLEVNDSLRLRVTESDAVVPNGSFVQITDSDSLRLLLTESDNIMATGSAFIADSDSLRLRIQESDSIEITNHFPDSDSLRLRATESDSIVITGLVQIIDSDSLRLRATESDVVFPNTPLVQITDSDSLRLRATESDVIVPAAAPMVNAGGPYVSDVLVAAPITGVVVPGTDPAPTFLWTVLSGGTGVFGDPSQLATTFTADLESRVILLLTVTPNDGPPVTATAPFTTTNYTGPSNMNDDILLVTGGPTVNDGLLSFYRINGAVSLTLVDAEREFLIARGQAPSDRSTMWFNFLTGVASLTLSGTMSDMKADWWAAGAPLI